MQVGVWLLMVSVALAAASPVAGQTVTITDGDTLKLGGTIYRLWGIDAPETKQDCSNGWPAGRLAATRLQALVQGRTITCEEKDRDRYGRVVAICRASGEDLGAIMVREGMAWAFVRYSRDYVSEEKAARVAMLGVHAHQCDLPWEWRARGRGDR
jgi:endonuclease YncB( thermonuclease family)